MKTKFILLIPVAALLFFACSKDIEIFDDNESYIYFNMPAVLDERYHPTNQRIDSLFYSFALDDYTIQDMIIKVPINIIGVAADHDRQYKIEIVADETTATDADWDKSSVATTVIKKGELRDSLYVRIFRSEATETQFRQIVLRIVPNEEFKAGFSNQLKMKVSFTSILTPPDWWSRWPELFGPFYREKFVKWQEIYYLGADPTIVGGQPLYWNNMPKYIYYYESTLMFVRVLKQYFIDNVVYPDGDTSKPRILLP